MPAAWAAALRPDEAAAEPVASPQRPQAAERDVAVAQPLEAPDARPRGAAAVGSPAAAGVAAGSLAAAVEAAAGSPAAAVPVAAPAAQRSVVAPPMAACGWPRQAAVQAGGPAGDRRQGAAACRAQ